MNDSQQQDKYFVGVRFAGSEKSYYYSTKYSDLKIGDLVIVPSNDVTDIATVSTAVMNTAAYKSDMTLRPIYHKATKAELKTHEQNLAKAKEAIAIAQKEANAKNLPMDFTSASYSFDGSVITLAYTSTEYRVDFRELLPVLGSRFRARVNLKQIAARDRAKMVGGLGICGLPLCCSTFLTTFESIGISKMKNQMLAINAQKYSGPCEKLMCCLAYEDETYTLEKKDFPRIGQTVRLDEGDYSVNSFNIVSRTVRLVNSDKSDVKNVTLEEYRDMEKGIYTPKTEETVAKEEYHLPDFHIVPEPAKTEEKNDSPRNEERRDRNDRRDRNRNDRRDHHNRNQNNRGDRRLNEQHRDNKNPRNNNQNPANPQRNEGGEGRKDNNRFHRHHRPNNHNRPDNRGPKGTGE